jgi:NDP-sugar pyrophosphorylase family protein
MDAMILAAGLGVRLRPLTEHLPKPLVEVGGRPMLEWVARHLVEAGADRLIVNVHPHADQIVRFLEKNAGFGAEVLISREVEHPLDTGGGLLAAAPYFRRDAPFFIYNGDVLTGTDLVAMYQAHIADPSALVTLAVGGRDSSRYLTFDEWGLLGYGNERTGLRVQVREPRGASQDLPFAGLHVASPDLFDLFEENGVFSIITTYMRLARAGRRIVPFDIGNALWLEVGNLDRLEHARAWAEATDGGRNVVKGFGSFTPR